VKRLLFGGRSRRRWGWVSKEFLGRMTRDVQSGGEGESVDFEAEFACLWSRFSIGMVMGRTEE